MSQPNLSNATQPAIAVIGAGIIGLTCVAELIEAGYNKIAIYAENITPYTTSDVAAATCFPQKIYPEPENSWYQNNLFKLKQLLSVTSSGVSEMNFIEVCRDSSIKTNGYKCIQKKNIFLVNSKYHIKFLMDILANKKISINSEKINNIHQLTKHYEVIINCSGLGSRELFNDQNVYPVRGQVVILSRPKDLNECIVELTENLTYIIPRDKDCILGGTEEINNWSVEPDEKTTRLIIGRAEQILPLLKNEKILDVKVGLRPVRNRIRLETEKIDQSFIIHNYGHGGEGYSFAWGCAAAVKNILKKESS